MSTPAHAHQVEHLIHLDPSTLHMGLNVRPGSVDTNLVDSIREHGVLQAINVYADQDGNWTVEDGQSRTLAAVEAGRETIPCRVIDAPEDSDDGRASLLLRQYDQNERRRGLTAAEQANTVEQLAAFGVSAAQIAKRTKIDRATVEATTRMGQSTRDQLDEGTLTLDQAAALDQFEDEDVQHDLVKAAGQGQFDHALARARQNQAIATARADAEADATERGWQIVDQYDYEHKSVRGLVDADGQPAEVDENDPGEHVAVRINVRMGYVDTRNGEPVDGWRIHNGPGETPDGSVPAEHVERRAVVSREWVCTKPKARGWRELGSTTRPTADEMTAAEREAARADRARTIAGNKAWDAAQDVRRDFLASLVTRKSAPKGGQTFTATTMLRNSHRLAHFKTHHLLAELGVNEVSDQAAKATATAFVIACAAVEAGLDRKSWREPMPGTGDYLRVLETAGYALAPVERAACGEDVPTDEL